MKSKYFYPFYIIVIVLTVFSFILRENIESSDPRSLEESIARGGSLYKIHCITCHMENGKGIPGVFPPLAQSDFLLKKPEESIRAVINGLSGTIEVNGQSYFGEMTPIKLTDQEVADVLNFARNSWDNEAEEITPDEVASERSK